jgi:Domain of unknown function (DUF4410)
MRKRILLLACGLALASFSLLAQEKTPAPPEPTKNSVIVVNTFTAAANVSWPYDMKELQRQTIAEMKTKLGMQFDIVTEPPIIAPEHVYTLNGEVVGWRAGNAAKRFLVGMGSGREAADIHYWIVDQTGKTILDKKDTIRSEFWGNAFAGSVGQLAHPFADKISNRIRDAKLK